MAITKPPPDDQNPWFRVDLEDLYLVQTVKIIRRLDCCFGHMETVEVRVGKSTIDSLFKIVDRLRSCSGGIACIRKMVPKQQSYVAYVPNSADKL